MRKGFTIVGLLIVIIVIAILATISIVAYNGIRERATAARFQSQLTQIRKDEELKYIESGEWSFESDVRAALADNDPSQAQQVINHFFGGRIGGVWVSVSCVPGYDCPTIDNQGKLRWIFKTRAKIINGDTSGDTDGKWYVVGSGSATVHQRDDDLVNPQNYW